MKRGIQALNLQSKLSLTAHRDVMHVGRCLLRAPSLLRMLGPVGLARFTMIEPWRRVVMRTRQSEYSVSLRPLPDAEAVAIICRQGSTDRIVISEIFAAREYDGVEASTPVRRVIDAGANIGCASIWFLTHFPDSTVLAIEPDEENFESLRRNTAAFGDRISYARKALWCEDTLVDWDPEPFGDDGEWARSVRAANGKPGEIEAISMSAILDAPNRAPVDILKIDIEGAEVEVFSERVDEWLPEVRSVVIELHDDEADRTVSRWFAPAEFSREDVRDVTIFRRRG